jgi:hypothetical protein
MLESSSRRNTPSHAIYIDTKIRGALMTRVFTNIAGQHIAFKTATSSASDAMKQSCLLLNFPGNLDEIVEFEICRAAS